MRRWEKSLACLLIAAVLLTSTASAHSHISDTTNPLPTVSSWAQEEVNLAQELGLVPEYGYLPEDYRTPITRDNFRLLAMNFVAVQEHYDIGNLEDMVSLYLCDKDDYGVLKNGFNDASQENTIAFYLGVVQGRGNGIFDPEGLITRQEAAAMMTRAYGVCGGTLPVDTTETTFSDDEQIADWAKESTVSLASWNVIKGMEDGSFSPDGQCTVEQCIVMFLRLYENAPVSRKNGNIAPLFSYEQGMEYVTNLSDMYYETLRIEGPTATLVRMDLGGVMLETSSLFFVYRDGGVKNIDLGVCDQVWGLTPSLKLENPSFSEDGKTLFFTITLEEDVISYVYNPSGELISEKGIYHMAVDVDTGKYQILREDLPE